MTLIHSYSAAITILCFSLLLDYIQPNKRNYFSSSPRYMSENDQTQVDSLLTAWVKTHLGALYHGESPTGEEIDFETAFNSTFSEEVSIYINHERISRNELENRLRASRSALSRPTTIDWKEVLEIPTKSEEITISAPRGIVAGFFIVTRSLKFKIRASNAQSLSYNSFSARVSQVEGQTRITELFLTFGVHAAPFNLFPTQP